MSRVFVNDPLITYIFLKLSREERVGFLETYFLRAINSVALNGAIITEANGWCAAAVMVPPGSTWSDFRTKSQTGMLSVARKIGFRGCWVSDLLLEQYCCFVRFLEANDRWPVSA